MSTYFVPDMNCKHCAARITKALNDAGFADVQIELEAKKVNVEGDAVKALAAIEKAGYSPEAAN